MILLRVDEDEFLRKIGGMRRLTALACAFAALASTLAAGGGAAAKDHHDGPRGEQQQRGRGGDEGRWNGAGRGGPPMGWRGEAPGNGRWGDRGGEQRAEPRYDPRYDPRNEPRYDQRNDQRYDPRAYAPPRRGGYLGPQGGAPIEDPGRYRLRPPPRGYEWVRVPGGMALVSQSTGQVFDVVPY